MVYTVTLNPAIDYEVRLPSLLCGEILRSEREEFRIGGKGINVSLMLRELGIPSVALGFTAGFIGEAIERGLETAGIGNGMVRLPEGHSRINVKIRDGRETDINGCGPEVDEASREALCSRVGRLSSDDWLILSGSAPGSLPSSFAGRLLSLAAACGARTVADVSGEMLREALRRRPYLVKPNRSELEDVLGEPADTEEKVLMLAGRLKDMGAENVLVSLGEDGCLLLTADGRILRRRAVLGNVVNTVGAGDATVAGFVAGIISTGDFGEGLLLGTAAGSATAFSPGIAGREAVERIRRQMIDNEVFGL